MIYQFINREINEKTIVIWNISRRKLQFIHIITNNIYSFIKVKIWVKNLGNTYHHICTNNI